ncbi:veneno [Haematobia irritans]|uniref:veneno n=1 Tax=Haematobia irritans TaxID=7368 RepID=UPI003F506727
MHRFPRHSTANGACEETSDPISEESEKEEYNNRQNGGNRFSEGKLVIEETGYCSLCAKKSVCKCERCGDFYCSPECQRKDWPSHRFICFPMPRLIKTTQSTALHESLPTLKADVKPIEVSKEESRQAYKARQLSFIPNTTPLPEDGSTVVVTGFKSANRCYIRSADSKVTDEYNKILKKIDNFGKYSNELTGVPKANTYAIAQKNDQWCRVQILSARPENKMRIHFIDYGTTSIRDMRELRKISSAICSSPSYVHMVQLHDVTLYSMQANVMEKLEEYVGDEFKVRFVNSDDMGGNVELYYMKSQALLNTDIMAMCKEFAEKENEQNSTTSNDAVGSNGTHVSPPTNNRKTNTNNKTPPGKGAQGIKEETNGTPEKTLHSENDTCSENTIDASLNSSAKKKNLPRLPKQIAKPCLDPPFKTVPLDEELKNIKMVVVDTTYINKGYVGCILEQHCDKLQAIQKFLQNHGGAGQPYKPTMDEYCIAEYESEWYRGKVVEIVDNDVFLISYIDFTNECELTSKSIRRYPMDLDLPCCTTLCGIEGLPDELSDEVTEFLEKELGGFAKIHVNSVSKVDEVILIECRDLIKKLKNAKLM